MGFEPTLHCWNQILSLARLPIPPIALVENIISRANEKCYNRLMSKVYFTKQLDAEGLIKVYEALGVELAGKVGVKVSTGEKGSQNYLKAELIKPLVKKLSGTIIECNTAYPGARNKADEHLEVAREHGFDFAEIDIMDESGEFEIPVEGGKHLEYDIVGEGLKKYDAMLNLAHFKGHAMGGFGGVLKNQSIGVASRNGKAYIHSAGKTKSPTLCWVRQPKQEAFIESMAEAAKAVADYFAANGKKILYIDVMNNMSVDCDCDANQGAPVMADIGILASEDPVALDQAAIDLIWASNDNGAGELKERIDSRVGRHILPYAEEIGLGTTKYELVEI